MSGRLNCDIRIWHTQANTPVGVGFVASPTHVITCAHVIADALGDRMLATRPDPPSDEIEIDFPMLAASEYRETRRGAIHSWRPIGAVTPDDLAILELNRDAPKQIEPVSICTSYSVNDHLLAYGVRSGLPNGAYLEARILGLIPGPLLQVVSDNADTALRQGCSGGAAWNLDRSGVIGMVAMGQLELSGLLTPIDSIAKIFFEATGRTLVNAEPMRPGTVVLSFLADSDRIEAIVSSLCRLPLGPAVDGFLIKFKVIRAFAVATDRAHANGIIAEACELVLRALPCPPVNREAYVVEQSELPGPSAPILDFWSAVFGNACMLGPRMVGALLLAAPAPVVNGAKSEIVELFLKLEGNR